MPSLFDRQPTCCRAPLPLKEIKSRSRYAAVIARILPFDPAPAFERIALHASPYKRIQTRANINLELLFPKNGNGYCDCGCGVVLGDRKRRWASAECSDFVWHVYAIIAGRRTEIKRCLKAYYGRKCMACGIIPSRVPSGRGRTRSGIEYDHITPVHRGGGACWLSNYRLLCVDCHRAKTRADRAAAKTNTGTREE